MCNMEWNSQFMGKTGELNLMHAKLVDDLGMGYFRLKGDIFLKTIGIDWWLTAN